MVVAITFVLQWVVILSVVNNEGRGRLDGALLSAERFGVPEAYVADGFRPLYVGPNDTGWDGQFYFYISNDPLARTPVVHIDTPPYRYQRIGLPGTTWVAAQVLGVSPTPVWLYYLVSTTGVALGAGAFAFLLSRVGLSPWFSLLWAAHPGVLVVQSNGLPDAFADAALLVMFAGLLAGRNLAWRLVGVASGCLAVLSREQLVLPVAILTIAVVVRAWLGSSGPPDTRARAVARRADVRWTVTAAAAAAACWIGWQSWVYARFDVVALTVGGSGIIQPVPFAGVDDGLAQWGRLHTWGDDARLIILWALLVVATMALTVFLLRNRAVGGDLKIVLGALVLAPLVLLLLNGGVVWFHWTGFAKVSTFILLPWAVAATLARGDKRAETLAGVALGGSVAVVVALMLHATTTRFAPATPNAFHNRVAENVRLDPPVESLPEGTCATATRPEVELVSVEPFSAPSAARLLRRGGQYVALLEASFPAAFQQIRPNVTHVGVQVFDRRTGALVTEGRGPLPAQAAAGTSVQVPVYLNLAPLDPRPPLSQLDVRPGYVTELCEWRTEPSGVVLPS